MVVVIIALTVEIGIFKWVPIFIFLDLWAILCWTSVCGICCQLWGTELDTGYELFQVTTSWQWQPWEDMSSYDSANNLHKPTGQQPIIRQQNYTELQQSVRNTGFKLGQSVGLISCSLKEKGLLMQARLKLIELR